MPKTQVWTPADGFTRQQTSKVQERPKPPSEIETLITQLSHRDAKHRQKAAQILSQRGEAAKAAIPALIQTLKTETDKAVIGVAAFALSQMGEAAVEPLIALLTEKRLHLKVAQALRKIGTPQAMKALEAEEPQKPVTPPASPPPPERPKNAAPQPTPTPSSATAPQPEAVATPQTPPQHAVTPSPAAVPEDVTEPTASQKTPTDRKPKQPPKQKPSAGDFYFLKQIREQTPMVLLGYGQTLQCTVVKLLRYDLVLDVNGEQQTRKKTDFSCYYKQRDAEKVEAAMQIPEVIVKRGLCPILSPKGRYQVKDQILSAFQARQKPITIALRTGHLFIGVVQWFTPYDIALRLQTGGKVKIFRHAIYAVR